MVGTLSQAAHRDSSAERPGRVLRDGELRAASVTSLSPSRTSTDPHLSQSTDRHLACNIAVLLPEMRTVVRWKALKHTFQMSTGFRWYG